MNGIFSLKISRRTILRFFDLAYSAITVKKYCNTALKSPKTYRGLIEEL